MLIRKNKILVIGHEASLSGAPLLLLNISKLLIEQGTARIYFVINKDGPLTAKYRKIAPVTVLKAADYGNEKLLFRKVLNFVVNKFRLLCLVLITPSHDLILSNTIVNGKLLRLLSFFQKPVITYVHELEGVIDLYIKQKDAVFSLKHSHIFAYPSLKVKNTLAVKYGINPSRLHKLSYYFAAGKNTSDYIVVGERRKAFRAQYGIGENEFLIGSMGTVSDRKGTDIFIEVCERVVAVNHHIKFCWIGAFESKASEAEYRAAISQKKLSNNIIFTGVLQHDLYNAAAFDLFFLSSREDPYPLVVLEAAIAHVPAICFLHSGGIVEFVGEDAGWIINDFSADEAAQKILGLSANKNTITQYSQAAFKKVVELHCNSALIVDEFQRLLKAVHQEPQCK